MVSSSKTMMDASLSPEPRRRTFAITSRGEPGELAAIEFGDPARPIDVIFLHANGFNAMTYRSVLAPLTPRLRLLGVDVQGYGLSPQRSPTEGRLNMLDLRDDLIALVDVLDGPPLVFAGHSMGGTIAVLTAAQRPDRVKAVALFDPVILSREVAQRAMSSTTPQFPDGQLAVGARRRRAVFASKQAVVDSYRGRGAFATWPERVLVDYVTDGFRERDDGQVELTCAPAWESASFSAHGHDIWGALETIHAPIVILRAETESTCSVEAAADFHAANPRSRVETIAGATHFLPIERPDLVRETLLEAAG
jgi:pimeloyl-ACP methyl ester carboxylesterase